MNQITRVVIVDVTQNAGISKKTNTAYDIREAQCIVVDENGKKRVGTFVLPRDLQDTPSGEYDAVFSWGFDYEGNVLPRVIGLNAISGKGVLPAAAAVVAKTV